MRWKAKKSILFYTPVCNGVYGNASAEFAGRRNCDFQI